MQACAHIRSTRWRPPAVCDSCSPMASRSPSPRRQSLNSRRPPIRSATCAPPRPLVRASGGGGRRKAAASRLMRWPTVMGPARLAPRPGANVANAKQGDAGRILADGTCQATGRAASGPLIVDGVRASATIGSPRLAALREFLSKVGVPDGLKAFGYAASDIPRLAAGAMPQVRIRSGAMACAHVFSLIRPPPSPPRRRCRPRLALGSSVSPATCSAALAIAGGGPRAFVHPGALDDPVLGQCARPSRPLRAHFPL